MNEDFDELDKVIFFIEKDRVNTLESIQAEKI